MNDADELERFKRIDLRAYAASQGYQLDKRESWRGSSVMRDARGDKIVIKRGSDGHYVYFSVRRDDDNGSIIDWVQYRQNLSLGAVRKELRPWIGQPPVPIPIFPELHATTKDRLRVEAEYRKMQGAQRHPYLEYERALPASLLGLERFAGRVQIDTRGNAVFPHFDAQGLCGFEIKNRGFNGFSSGGTKGLWVSQEEPDDNRLAVFESAIDALSYAVLFPDERTRFASVGGSLNPAQPELIRAAAAKLALGSSVVAAMDNDRAGRDLTEVVRRAVELTGRSDLGFVVHVPEEKDWNDMLRGRARLPLPSGPEELSFG